LQVHFAESRSQCRSQRLQLAHECCGDLGSCSGNTSPVCRMFPLEMFWLRIIRESSALAHQLYTIASNGERARSHID
jgi:hypothetical protein